ncbi:glycosyltransferase [Flavobacterium sp. ZS1P14]|uniref:glycosyltransferase n=1 Tax=Flavobacterium sp. ZS1P14 TaxID=3401729 RepID=UPI003AABDCD6
MNITASVVLYNNDFDEISRLLRCLAVSKLAKIFIVDNSLSDRLISICSSDKIIYIHNPTNPGFGAAHNKAIKNAIDSGSNYHFIINPDIYFEGDVISPMIDYMKNDTTIGMMMPQILNLDGTVQNLPKLLPSPLNILWRKIKKPEMAYQKFINEYELRKVPKELIYNAPILSGCFTLLNLKAIKEIGFYDDTYFMYFEDWDLSRRMHVKYKTIYFPEVSVYHGYDSGANKSSKLFKIFINSAIVYFNKWGWFFDSDRKEINKRALAQFK